MSQAIAQLNQSAIRDAAQRIAPHVRQTPVMDVDTPAGPVNLKLECLQRSGTFKARGAFNNLLSAREPVTRVAAASGGNHGAAVACAAQALGLAADIFVPQVSSAAKRALIAGYGANIHIGGDFYAQAAQACETFVAEHQAMTCHAYDSVATLQGQGTLAMEWQNQVPDLQTVLVAVGGGGLIGGMAAWLNDSVRIIAVESEGCPTFYQARQQGAPVDIEVGGLAADSLGARRIGQLMFGLAKQYVDDAVLVSDQAIRRAMAFAWDEWRLALEPGGAAALAAWLDGRYRPAGAERVGVLLCGANGAAPESIHTAPDRK